MLARGEFAQRPATPEQPGDNTTHGGSPSAEHTHAHSGGLKSVDRAMEKLTRSYQGNVSIVICM